jgi:hypothetical protein
MNVKTWLSHLDHLQVGDRYMKGCPICEIPYVESEARGDVTEDVRFYNQAQKSGKRSVGFDKL